MQFYSIKRLFQRYLMVEKHFKKITGVFNAVSCVQEYFKSVSIMFICGSRLIQGWIKKGLMGFGVIPTRNWVIHKKVYILFFLEYNPTTPLKEMNCLKWKSMYWIDIYIRWFRICVHKIDYNYRSAHISAYSSNECLLSSSCFPP